MRCPPSSLNRLFQPIPTRVYMSPIVFLCALLIGLTAADGDGHVVQFIVHASHETEISRLFPGADVQFTWNDIYIVRIWTHDPQGLIPQIQSVLDNNTEVIQVIVPPLTLTAATQKWIEYNLVWALLLVMVFISGCACGAVIVYQCIGIKHAAYSVDRCRTGC